MRLFTEKETMTFSEIQKKYPSCKRTDHHLNVLVHAKLLRKVPPRGTYQTEPLRITELSHFFKVHKPVSVISGLGTAYKNFLDFEDVLGGYSIKPIKYIVIGSKKVVEDFKNTFNPTGSLRTKSELKEIKNELVLEQNYGFIYKRFKEILEKEILHFRVILSLNSDIGVYSVILSLLKERYNCEGFWVNNKTLTWV